VRRLLHLINEIPLAVLLTVLTAIVALFAIGYWALAHTGPGYLVSTYDSNAVPGLADALYFSIVTISSLGYGDIRPVGPARVLVSLEVIVGLAFLGLLVAKVSSVKQDYILTRIYSDRVDAKLETYVHELEEQRALYRNTSQLLLDGGIDPDLTTTFRRDTPGTTFFIGYRQLLSDVADLMTFEASNGVLFGEVDDSRIEAVLDAVRGVLRRTTLLWERDHIAASQLIFRDNGLELEHICDFAEQLAKLGKRGSRNSDIVSICDAILTLSGLVRAEILPAV
jgi:hypothetical protein